MQYLIDGYNVTHSDPATRSCTLEEQREALVARLAARGADLLGRGPITVVFDGVAGGMTEAGRGQVVVRYAHRPETADDLIVRLVASGETTVVTDDNGLAARARVRSAVIVPSASCFEQASTRKVTGRRYRAASAGLPPGAAQITAELKKLWLEDGE
ncbi:MAG: NYN domain-containing protein [Coriobacteriia bacterium]|nr:NYN domain-containing protein [Coriobacteriia bacterium]